MLNLPEKKYQIYDATDTDDLVLWTILDHPSNYVMDQGLRRRVTQCLPQATCFSGPINSQQVFDPLLDEPIKLPVHYHFNLDSQRQKTLLLIITTTTIELHLPELWFVTGKPEEDDQRMKLVRNLTSRLSSAFGIEWKHAEYSGTVLEMSDNDAFWDAFLYNLFTRIEYEE
ncbi:MAG: hypothetical protein QM501_06815 [Gimesia sp.]